MQVLKLVNIDSILTASTSNLIKIKRENYRENFTTLKTFFAEQY